MSDVSFVEKIGLSFGYISQTVYAMLSLASVKRHREIRVRQDSTSGVNLYIRLM